MDSRKRSYPGFPRVHHASLAALVCSFLMASGVGAIPRAEVPGFSAREADPYKVLPTQSSWTFNCYSPGQPCRGTGNTAGGGRGTTGCNPIDSRGCSQYSFDGGGIFKLCLYTDGACSQRYECVNGGKVSCIVVNEEIHSWKILV